MYKKRKRKTKRKKEIKKRQKDRATNYPFSSKSVLTKIQRYLVTSDTKCAQEFILMMFHLYKCLHQHYTINTFFLILVVGEIWYCCWNKLIFVSFNLFLNTGCQFFHIFIYLFKTYFANKNNSRIQAQVSSSKHNKFIINTGSNNDDTVPTPANKQLQTKTLIS